MPEIFTDEMFAESGTWRLSTSNCSNPALQSFSFGPVCSDGLGIGYLVHKDSINVSVSSWEDAAKYNAVPSASEFTTAVVEAFQQMQEVMTSE